MILLNIFYPFKTHVRRRAKSLSCVNFSKVCKKTYPSDKHKRKLYTDPFKYYNRDSDSNGVEMSNDIFLTSPSSLCTTEFPSILPSEKSIDDLYTQIKQIYETLTILTGGVKILRDDLIRLSNGFSQVESNINTHYQEQMILQQSVEEQYAFLSGTEMNQQILDQELTNLKQDFENSKYISYDGTFVWKIKNVTELMNQAQCESQPSIYSPPFYSSSCGYKMCMRLYLNGDGNAKRTHISLFFVLLRGEYDAMLKWPFHFKVTFCLIDQSGQQRHIIDSFRPDIKSNSFQIPKSLMNIASGIPKFFPLPMLQQAGNNYVKDDTMFLRCIVDFNDMPKMILPFSLSLNPGLPDHIQKSMIKEEIERQQQSSTLPPQITKVSE
ncbi:unnamed protein product [Didymodactylos carnosus]|uniref:MATH domain-containing protein n=1 Tax=Didymodactylos carnosus TaxID=1234261 RepID=A0A815UT45_9BILA|nr:unnamed protein product [Didymodactylos carnosus]CAF1520290.1 unnamed protein product [Didymodactylos carnosus]CAF4120055.1 unnamed protein product [Didymodactylos carnosus]CAF4379794.1 unnamed protein product [Didymodactylos carnosus]